MADTFALKRLVCPLSEIHATVLLPQLAKLDQGHRIRAGNVAHLLQRLRHLPGIQPLGPAVGKSSPAYYKLGLQYNAEEFGVDRATLVAAMRAEGIAFDESFRGLHVGRSPKRFRRGGDFQEAERADQGMLVLHHPVLLGRTHRSQTQFEGVS
jgi:dTDP-4-amino-4,6-dideoxygalactose transaminase